jgi:hypothetical protein
MPIDRRSLGRIDGCNISLGRLQEVVGNLHTLTSHFEKISDHLERASAGILLLVDSKRYFIDKAGRTISLASFLHLSMQCFKII